MLIDYSRMEYMIKINVEFTTPPDLPDEVTKNIGKTVCGRRLDDSDRGSLPSDYALPPNTGFESYQVVAGKGARLTYMREYTLP